MRASLAACALLASAPSCPDLYSLATHGFSVPTLDASTATAAVDPAGLRVRVQLIAHNPNPYPIALTGVDYQVSLQGQPVFSGTQADPAVPEHGQKTLGLEGVIDLRSAAYRSLRTGQPASYAIAGTAHIDSPAGVPLDVEFESDGSFVVPAGLPTP